MVLMVPLSMTDSSFRNAWAGQESTKVSPRGESRDQLHKSEIEIIQKQKTDSQPTSATLDCKWEQIKEKGGIAWKCVGKDCEKCTKQVPSKAQSLKGRTCCKCEKTGSYYICRGDCCHDVIGALSSTQMPQR
jgi:hypothetical protein